MRIRSSFAVVVFSFVFLALSASSSGQQVDSAIIVGSVIDPSGGAVVGATVAVTHLSTNSVTDVRTDERGQYRTPPLRLGEYTISVDAPRFKNFTQRGVILSIGDVREIDVTLQVGQSAESVIVVAEAPLLQTGDSTVGTVITNQPIEELPLNGRDYLQLAALSAGTVPSLSGGAGIAGVGISIGGQVGLQVAFLLDGQDNNSEQLNTTHSQQKEIIKPSVDAIAEFKVITNGNSAEYGRSASGVISVATKSGTNQIHGSAFDFYRNAALDAENLFTPPGESKPPFGRNQYGASIGGPVIHDKTFFFGDFEIARIRTTDTTTSLLPTQAQKEGLFSTPITNPATGTPFPQNAAGQYAIPVTSFDPIAAKILPYIANPQPGVNGAGYNYVYPSPDNQNNHRWDFRIDQTVSSKQNMFFRFSDQVSDLAPLVPLPPEQGNYISVGTSNTNDEIGAQVSDSKSFVLGDNYVWSPSLVSSIRAGWNYMYWDNTLPPQSLTDQTIGIPGITANWDGFSSMAITGYQTFGITNVPNSDLSEDRELEGDLTWTKGPHTLKFGVQMNWLQTGFNSSQSNSGTFSFNGQYTGNAFADFLLGDVSSISLSKILLVEQRTPLKHFFVQDDWRATHRLTLNLGLRYELSPPAVDLIPGITNVNLPSLPPANPGPLMLYDAGPPGSGRQSQSLLGVDYHQFAPRLGFAYSLPDNKTVLRGGWGIFYSYLVPLRPENNPPNQVTTSRTTDPTGPPSLFLDQGVPQNALSVANATNVTLTSLDTRPIVPIDQQWSFDIQRQLPSSILVEVGYYGNKLDHLWRTWNGNQLEVPEVGKLANNIPYKTAIVPGTPTPISLSTSITRETMDGYTEYNGLQARVEKRYSEGLTFLASYAYSKTMALGDASGVQNILDVAAERAVALQDMTQHFVGSAIYELPFGKDKRFGSHWNSVTNAFLGGWSISPILTIDSGFPLNLTENTNPSNVGGTDRPNINGNWHLAHPTIQEWFNTSVFTKNAALTYGDVGRDILRGPGVFNLDFAAHKSFQITERVSAQLRLESFNITNTPALGPPGTVLGATSTFGVISSAGPPRDNQIALKVLF
ncbi:MAG: carboxypeptidase regulatory-like domain-containing protein [Candidatus Acidiferrales bacterium]|jgi:hypothetical protein